MLLLPKSNVHLWKIERTFCALNLIILFSFRKIQVFWYVGRYWNKHPVGECSKGSYGESVSCACYWKKKRSLFDKMFLCIFCCKGWDIRNNASTLFSFHRMMCCMKQKALALAIACCQTLLENCFVLKTVYALFELRFRHFAKLHTQPSLPCPVLSP